MSSAQEILAREIGQRLDILLARLADGDDIPPGSRLRLEGMLESAVLVGSSMEELRQQIRQCYRPYANIDVDSAAGESWVGHAPFPELPLFLPPAPVNRQEPEV